MERKIEFSLILFSIFTIFQSAKISGSELTSTSSGAFPLFISVLLLIFSLWIFVEGSKEKEGKVKYKIFTREIGVIILLLVLYALLLELLGFGIATFGFLFISISYLSKKEIFKNLIISSLTVLIIIFIFKTVFKVILP